MWSKMLDDKDILDLCQGPGKWREDLSYYRWNIWKDSCTFAIIVDVTLKQGSWQIRSIRGQS